MRSLVAALALIAGAPVAAQGLDTEDCRAVWDAAMRLGEPVGNAEIEAKTVRAAGGWCIAEGLTLPADVTGLVRPTAEYLRWRGRGLRVFAETGAVPEMLEIELENLRLIPEYGKPVLEYAVAAQMARDAIDGSLRVSLDPETGTLELHRLEVRFPGDDGVIVTARAEGVNLSSSVALAKTATTGALHEIGIEARNDTGALFEQIFLVPLATAFLNEDTPPATQVEELKAEALAIIDALPEDAYPPETRFALSELIVDMPNPNGTFTLNITFDGGFGMQQAREAGDAMAEADIPALWRNAVVKARYDRVALPH